MGVRAPTPGIGAVWGKGTPPKGQGPSRGTAPQLRPRGTGRGCFTRPWVNGPRRCRPRAYVLRAGPNLAEPRSCRASTGIRKTKGLAVALQGRSNGCPVRSSRPCGPQARARPHAEAGTTRAPPRGSGEASQEESAAAKDASCSEPRRDPDRRPEASRSRIMPGTIVGARPGSRPTTSRRSLRSSAARRSSRSAPWPARARSVRPFGIVRIQFLGNRGCRGGGAGDRDAGRRRRAPLGGRPAL